MEWDRCMGELMKHIHHAIHFVTSFGAQQYFKYSINASMSVVDKTWRDEIIISPW